MGSSGSKADAQGAEIAQQQVQAPEMVVQQQIQAQDASHMLVPEGLQQQVQAPMAFQPRQRLQAQGLSNMRMQRGSLGQSSCMSLGGAETTTFNDDDPLQAAVAVVQAEPEPDTSSMGSLSVATRVEYSALPSGQTQDVFGLVTIQAAPAPKPAEGADAAERQPIDIVCVLDVSGSMQGDKIRQVQDATRFIIGQADPKDRVSIVAFNNRASRVIRLCKMNAEGKNDANVATLRLSAGGGTSIAAGLDVALSVMEQRRQRNKVSAILLLTDGQDGSTRGRVPDLLRRAAAANCTVYTFGFGRDHDAALLSEIAEQARTPFTFVEDTEKIGEAFAGAVGGLTSIVAQQIEVSLKCRVPLKTIHTPFPLQQSSPQDATITIPDMFALERRDILVELAVPADGDGAGQMILLEASAQYTDLKRNVLVQTAPVAMEAQRVEEPQPEAEPDEEVSAQRERVEVTRTLQDAAAASDRGQFEDALHMLDEADKRMKCAKKQSPLTEALGQELADARNRMRSRSMWEQGGRAECLDAAQMHKMQRCTNMMQSSEAPMKMSKAMYCSPTQDAWIQTSKSRGRRG